MFVALPILVQGLLILIPHCKAETNEDKIAAMLSRLGNTKKATTKDRILTWTYLLQATKAISNIGEVVEKKVEQVEKENEALKKENKRISEKLETCECANSQTDIDVKGPGETAQVKYNNKNKLNGTTSLRPPSSQIQNVKTLNSEAHKRRYRKRLSLGSK
ncbi:Hypothetical predicted protein [Mytilus galloprovincialis]|uniref:Uncharacterized protein n=1 Tax=Mytilus galloprovincialis TaxID=29158 RepID=A0A8B6DHM4_MYTGA|nr:Hypothetical predicted protein [Mytilus galloprovincialis]